MRGRGRYQCETVCSVNGFDIEREKIGASVYWNAFALNGDGYVRASYRNCGSKAGAIRQAKEHVWNNDD